MASKLVLVLGICIFALSLLSPVTAIDDDHAVENKKAALQATPSGPVAPGRRDHYVTGCKRCCYLDEYGCITCCSKKDMQAFLPTAGRKEKAALVANSGHR